MKHAFLFSLGLCLAAAVPAVSQPVSTPFTFDLKPQNLPTVRNGSVSWADIDGDGHLDALVQGIGSAGNLSEVYRNVEGAGGSRSFEPLTAGLPGLAHGKAAWADMDGDGDLDLALTGSRTAVAPYQPVTLVFRNNEGVFLLDQLAVELPGVHSGALVWGDVDNDGDQDLLVTGVDSDGFYRSFLGRNNGTGGLEAVDPGIPGFAFGDARWGDYDADGDVDLLISGATDEGFRTAVYRNDGGVLTNLNAPMTGLAFASVDWGDYDSDGDLDAVVAGGEVSPRIFQGRAVIYRNANGQFAPDAQQITGTLAGSVTWGDYDNDGDLDLLSFGAQEALGSRAARVFRNDGPAGFVGTSVLVGAIFASADWGDYDGDGDLDLLTSGATSYGASITNLYENGRQVRPPLPLTPQALTAREEGATVFLSWTPPGDGLLSYDVRVGSSPSASDIRSVPADPATGLRLLGRPGSFSGPSTFFVGLPPGTYYWSVQAVGPTFAASEFAEEGQFTVSATATAADALDLPEVFALASAYPNPFSYSATLAYELPSTSGVTISVYDMLGRRMAVLVNAQTPAGRFEATWAPGPSVSGGVYLVEMRADGFRSTRTITLVR